MTSDFQVGQQVIVRGPSRIHSLRQGSVARIVGLPDARSEVYGGREQEGFLVRGECRYTGLTILQWLTADEFAPYVDLSSITPPAPETYWIHGADPVPDELWEAISALRAFVREEDDFVEVRADALDLGSFRAERTDPTPAELLTRISQWLDESNIAVGVDRDAMTFGRIAKLAEETGEAVAALIGVLGYNPRKGVTHSTDDVIAELLDVAITALAAVEHMTGHQGDAIEHLESKIRAVATRAGILEDDGYGVSFAASYEEAR